MIGCPPPSTQWIQKKLDAAQTLKKQEQAKMLQEVQGAEVWVDIPLDENDILPQQQSSDLANTDNMLNTACGVAYDAMKYLSNCAFSVMKFFHQNDQADDLENQNNHKNGLPQKKGLGV